MGQDSQTDPGPPLLFVNRDATNLSRTRAEAFAVGSHTSSVYRKWAKSERLRNLRREARVLQSAKVRLDPFPHGPEQSPVEKGYEVEDAESPRTVIALLKAAVVQAKQFSIPAKLSIDGQRHPPNFYRAMEYCTALASQMNLLSNSERKLITKPVIRVLVPNNLPVYSIFQVSNVNCLVSAAFLSRRHGFCSTCFSGSTFSKSLQAPRLNIYTMLHLPCCIWWWET